MNQHAKIIQFIQELYPDENNIPLHSPRFFGNEKAYLAQCIDTTFVSSVGPFVDRMERDLAAYTGAQYCVSMVNGTAALHIALKLAGVKPGDGVVTQAFSFIATSNAIGYCGASPLFIDIDSVTLGMSPQSLAEFFAQTEQRAEGCFHLPSQKIIKACVPMHSFGMPVDLKEIKSLCDSHGVILIEDAAESIGSHYQNQHTGTIGQMGVFSFNGNKTITCGGGGALVTNDAEIARRAKHMTTQSKVPHAYEFYHDEIGYNYRCPNINAALFCAQLENIDLVLANKRDTAKAYKLFFESNSWNVRYFDNQIGRLSNYWLNAVLFESFEEREDFIQLAIQSKIMVRPAWQPMHYLPMYQDCWRQNLEVTERVYLTLVNLPSSVRI
jgi:aminotransferase in exopolysaccharide biosynthesis